MACCRDPEDLYAMLPLHDVDCMVGLPLLKWGRRRALRSWIGLFDRGHLGPAGVTV